jgi:hypothetical protein
MCLFEADPKGEVAQLNEEAGLPYPPKLQFDLRLLLINPRIRWDHKGEV